MSYIRAEKVTPDEGPDTAMDIRVYREGDHTLDADMDFDFEVLNFVLGLIAEVDKLDEGEALVVWKQVF